MNKIINIMSAIVLLTLVYLVSSCTKHEFPIPGEAVSGAKLAFVQASEKSASVGFFLNGNKISSSATLATGVYGGANAKGTRFPQTDYCIFPAASADIATYVLGKVNVDSIMTSSLTGYNLESNKSYTYYYYDLNDGTQTSKIIEDVLPTLDLNTATVQFVNLVNNAADSVELRVTVSNEIPAATLPYAMFSMQPFASLSSTAHTFSFTGTAVSYTLTFEVWYIGPVTKKLVTKASEVVTRGRTYTVVAYGSKLGTVGFLKFINKAY